MCMSRNTPELGIALAAYRPNPSFFAAQLDSITDQTYKNWICLIGLDSKLEELQGSPELAPFLIDPRFVFLENRSRLGHKKNFENTARELLRKFPTLEFISFCDQDDVWYPEKLEKSIALLRTLPPYSGVQTDMHVLLPDGTQVLGWAYENKVMNHPGLPSMICNNHVAGTALVLRSEVIRDYGSIPDSFEFHDHWYGLIASTLGLIAPLPEPLFQYRQHGLNVTGASESVGLLKIRRQSGLFGALRESHARFRQCQNRLRDFASATRKNHFTAGWLYFSRLDLGIGFLLLALRHLVCRDQRRARSVLSMLAGKLVWIFGLQRLLNQYASQAHKL